MSTYVQNDFNWPKFSYVSFVNICIIDSHELISFCKFSEIGVGEQIVAKKAAWAEVNQERSEPLRGECRCRSRYNFIKNLK